MPFNFQLNKNQSSIDADSRPKLVGEKMLVTLVPSVNNGKKILTGKVLTGKGTPLPDVNIIIKDTTLGTSTDSKGNYSIAANVEHGVVVFSFVGFNSFEGEF